MIVPLTIAGFCSMKAMSTRNDEPERASRPFDAGRDGFVCGEGAGIVVLEALEHAVRRDARIYAEIVGYGMTGDAHHMTAPEPQGDGIRRAALAALADADLEAGAIDFVNAHGTGTPLNDASEWEALKTVFGARASELPLTSTKALIADPRFLGLAEIPGDGHAFGARSNNRIEALFKPIGSVSPSRAEISISVPATSASNTMFALSVSISTSSSPSATSSPTAFIHLRIVPSSIESERRGITTSAIRGSPRGSRGPR